ncbi:colicin V production protein [mine drainage metagenome]|uniref:Colicin V production protein n=1 Tax=mine drainage metagenome TaxID=410659 RepID=A0A1J5Q8K8_9ZZZZ
MSALDWIFTAVLLLSILLGAWRGLVYEVLSLMNWVAAFFLARWFGADVSHYLPMSGAGESVRFAAGFVLVFIAAVVLGGLIAVTIKKLTAAVGLAPVDRVLGAAFGLMRGVLLLLLATTVVAMTALKDYPAWQQSAGVRLSGAVLKALKPVLPGDLVRFVPV